MIPTNGLGNSTMPSLGAQNVRQNMSAFPNNGVVNVAAPTAPGAAMPQQFNQRLPANMNGGRPPANSVSEGSDAPWM
jgi:hypothetical protein